MSPELKRVIKALEQEKSGDWDGAHQVVQHIDTRESYTVHAYLHRKEGDLANAAYWYRRAGTQLPDLSLEQEWEVLHKELSDPE